MGADVAHEVVDVHCDGGSLPSLAAPLALAAPHFSCSTARHSPS